MQWPAAPPAVEFYDHFGQPMRIVPSMSSLDALLSKLPPVGLLPNPPSGTSQEFLEAPVLVQPQKDMGRAAKEEMEEEEYGQERGMVEPGGESSSSMPYMSM